MPWFHVNGIPVLAASKAAAVTAWREGRLIPIHDKVLAAELQEATCIVRLVSQLSHGRTPYLGS